MKSKTNVLVVLDTRRPKRDGTYQLLLRIIHNQTVAEERLNYSLHPKDWDERERKIKSSYKGSETVTRINNIIQKKKAELMDFITKLDDLKKLDALPHAKDIRNLFYGKAERKSILSYMQTIIDSMNKTGRLGSAHSYKTVKGILTTFGGQGLTFDDITYSFLVKLEEHHLSKGNSHNGLAVYMRTLRAVCNRAIKEGIMDRNWYPFLNYQIKTKKTQKRAISNDAIKSIEALILAEYHPLFHTRNYFLFSYYMRGLPFVDLAKLKHTNVIDGRIIYKRSKTEQPLDIKITQKIKSILEYYQRLFANSEYLFGIIKRTELEGSYKDIQWARKRYNKKLKKLAVLCNIENDLTSYVSRHSFASRARFMKIPIKDISQMLGHDRITTTEVYLANLPNDEMDSYHEKIIEDEA